jgi:membrane associated rhomboid family serine protease
MQTNSIGRQIKNFITSPAVLNRLILINIAVFLLVNIVNIVYKLGGILPDTMICGTRLNELIYFLALPAELQSLATRPWTFFTYMFLHEQLFHVFFNLFMLYVGGQFFVQFIGQKKLFSVYLMGGLVGAAFYVAAFNIFPGFAGMKNCSIAIGASASVLAVFIAIATYAPNYSVMLFLLGKIQLKYIALIMVAIDVISIDGKNPGGSIAHIGGALWGFLFAMQYRRNYKSPFNIDFRKFFALFKSRKPKMKAEYTAKPNRPLSDEEFNKIKVANQKRMDAILDKISKSGYKSLTAEEKEFLFKASRKD